MLRFALLALVLPSAANAAPPVSIRFAPACLPPARAGQQETIAVVLRDEPGSRERQVSVALRTPKGVAASPASRKLTLVPGRDRLAFFTFRFERENAAGAAVVAVVDAKPAGSLAIGEAYDLEGVTWKAKWDRDGVGADQGWMKPEFDDSDWADRSLPSMWQDLGVTYLRAKLFVPDSWRGKSVHLRFEAIDDNDICYLNGVEIGRTDGWDKPRAYEIKPDVIRFGKENVLCLAVDNIAHGGGIYRSPSSFGVAAVTLNSIQGPGGGKLAKPGPVGHPLPLRPMYVRDGVLLYPDGKEVALFGVNYYPQSWHQFESMKRLGVDMKQAIRDDLDDMKKMGVEAIRIHVFDREISDRDGNLIDNEHLDLLDYLISEASTRGIYFMFTPIAWWGGPNENRDSFSKRTPKEYMFCDDEAIKAAANYLGKWLNHKNRYTDRRYRDEPAICALEMMNEPAYADYNSLVDPDTGYYKYDPGFTTPFRERLLGKWKAWCASNGIDDERRVFPLFRYELMSRYLDTMQSAIRRAGAKQPVACALFDTNGQDDLTRAIADSKCEAVTTGLYAGAWHKVGDGVNYLPYCTNEPLDARLDRKARLVYEFDGIKTFGSYFYPACARRFRFQGVQIACMFQYDSSTTAEWNTDWDAHYLNWRYTPPKAVSLKIAARAFREIPRGKEFPTDGAEQEFGNCAVSFSRNASVYATWNTWMSSAPIGEWRPVALPDKPEFVTAVGDSPFASYSGSGVYTIRADYTTREAILEIEPDAVVVGDPWHPKADRSAVVLKNEKHPFTLKLPGVTLARVLVVLIEAKDLDGTGRLTQIEVNDDTFEARAGRYYLMW